MLNQTIKNDPNNRGHLGEEIENSLLFPIWQGLKDDYRTYCGMASFSEETKGVQDLFRAT